VCYPFAEDVCQSQQGGKYKMALFCVYDGHGALGDKVSHYVMREIESKLAEHPKLFTDPPIALKETFLTVDNNLAKNASIDAELSGTTGVVLLARQEMSGTKLEVWSACVGDSRAVAFVKDKTDDLTEDQKPDTPAEMARIKKAGGFVSPPEEEWGGPARVWLDAAMTLPGLAMARSIGDHLVKSVGVTADPEVVKYEFNTAAFTSADYFVMASDGVWEFISSEQATSLVSKFVNQQNDATVAVTKLIETAAAKWRQEEGDYRDDITAIVIRLKGLFDHKFPGE